MNNEIIKKYKRRLIKLEGKVKEFNNHRFILINIFNELNKKTNFKLNYLVYNTELHEEISYLDDWIEFYSKNIERCEARLRKLEHSIGKEGLEKRIKEIAPERAKKKEIIEKETATADLFKFISKEAKIKKGEVRKPIRFKEKLEIVKRPIESIFEIATKLDKNNLIKYGVPILLFLLIMSFIFISKPEITGYIVLTQEKTYDDNLNLVINESGNYTWDADKLGYIKAIKASGKVKGNGTVKIYIEKDGKRYLIFDNKKNK